VRIDLLSGFGTGLVAVSVLAARDGAWGMALLCLVSGAILVRSSFRRTV
jgi:hypothetical protein